MGMSVRAVVACAIPTAVAVIGFIFFWTRKKPEPDKKTKSPTICLKSDDKSAAPISMEQVAKPKESPDPQDVDATASGIGEEAVEEPVIQASELAESEAAPLVIEEELTCSEAQSIESAITPSFVDELESAPMIASNPSGLQCDEDISEKALAAESDETCASEVVAEAESTDGQCTCPTSSNGAHAGSSSENSEGKLSNVLSDRKRVDSGLEDSHGDMHIDNDKVNNSLAKPAVERPDSIPLSPRRPLPADSPNDHMNNSDSVSEASEASNDSGKGASVAENHIQMNGDIHIYQFAFPSELCGRLVGKHGKNINEIKDHSGAQITLVRQPFTKDSQICCLEGTEPEIHLALDIIKKRFPKNRFSKVNYDPIDAHHPAQSPVLSPDLMQLKLPTGVTSDAIVSSIVDASHVFLQQPTHPSFPSLERLNQCMLTCYSQDMTVPPLPKPVEGGVICAAPIMDGWYRAQVMTIEDEVECDIKFLDYGGYSRVPVADLRQIRSDFMTLPFQATECYMANIAPLADEEAFSVEAAALLEELTQGHLLQSEIVVYDEESGIPFVNLYRMDRDAMKFINRDLVNRGVVRWMEAV